MTKLPFKAVAMVAALAVGALAMSYQPAEAGRRHHRGHGGAAAAAIAGLAIGAIIAGSTSRRGYAYEYAAPPPPVYYAPPPPVVYGPPPVAYSYAPAPWTPEWYAYCARKYRSFDPASGTFQPYYGPRRLCR
jgi:hypothetical protein